MAVLTLDLGHLTAAEAPVSPALNQEFISAFREGKSPVTLSLTGDEEVEKIEKLAESIRRDYENVLLLGIGGSALGARAIISFLRGPYYNLRPTGPRLFIVDNLDPALVRETAGQLDMGKTCLIYVSKSGSTPETAAAFMYFSERVRTAGGRLEDTVIICDPGDNGINRLAGHLGCRILHLPSRLPGRYSVLSAAGLLPAALIGADIRELPAGARLVQQSLVEAGEDSPLLLLGNRLFALLKVGGKSIHVLFNYASILGDFGLWYMQLWSESLGKRESLTGETIHAGSTPLSCVGATDQHSLLQLFKEGPADKVYGFIGIRDQGEELVIPAVYGSEKEYVYLAGHSLQHQLVIEQLATQISLVNAGHPCYQLSLADQSPRSLGALFYFYQVLVAYMACLGEVDAFNQPGVEEGKSIAYSLLGRSDYQDAGGRRLEQVEAYREKSRLYHI